LSIRLCQSTEGSVTNKALRKDDIVASASIEFPSWNMILARCVAKKATSLTMVVDVAHVDPGIVIDGSFGEMLTARLSIHVVILCYVLVIAHGLWYTIHGEFLPCSDPRCVGSG
jgi:hypothetical protein